MPHVDDAGCGEAAERVDDAGSAHVDGPQPVGLAVLRMVGPAVVEHRFRILDDAPNPGADALLVPRSAARRLVRVGLEEHSVVRGRTLSCSMRLERGPPAVYAFRRRASDFARRAYRASRDEHAAENRHPCELDAPRPEPRQTCCHARGRPGHGHARVVRGRRPCVRGARLRPGNSRAGAGLCSAR